MNTITYRKQDDQSMPDNTLTTTCQMARIPVVLFLPTQWQSELASWPAVVCMRPLRAAA